MISIYIALRFEWKYAVPVLIALMHDILITAGVYSLTGREVTTSTVAALLTILGFSLYDTIIVFDRIRENVPRMPSAAFSQIVNRSMSEVIVRSLATSFCTLLPVLALCLFGGETLKDFAFALIVGTLSGAYSSIFIAGPVLTHWKEREPVYRAARPRIRESLGYMPAYAVATAGAPVDVEPSRGRGARRLPRRRTRPRASPGGVRRDGRATSASSPSPPTTRPGRRPRPRRGPAPGGRAACRARGRAADPGPNGPAGASNGPRATTERRQRTAAAGRGHAPKKPRNRRHGRPR